MMNRQQQRQQAREQRRLEARRKQLLAQSRSAQPQLKAKTSKKETETAPGGRQPYVVPEPNVFVRYWPWITAGVVLIALIALFFIFDPLGMRAPLPGTKVASQGNLHVNPGDSHVAYSTDPPTSGPHFPQVPQRGIYTTPFVTEYLPHFLEHGGVEVLYNKNASPEVVKKLTDIVNSELDRNYGNVLMAPRPDMPCTVAVTSWQHIETWGPVNCQPGWRGHEFEPNSKADINALKDFIERNQCVYDPENQCGNGPKGQVIYPTTVAGQPTVIASLGTATAISGPGMPQAPAKK
jgi:hypothetical protein